ncbi:MAG: ATP-grasp domain-containing protein [Streptosporangiaceae bacterium]|nr:ATP-grasp domain-containing protein [Streptosporangiaceae bacterium]
MSRSVVILLATGSLLIALGVGWRVIVTWRIRRRLIGLLGSADPVTRAGTLTILVAEGIERFAPALCRMSETETDPAVLDALAEVVSRTQAMPARTPDLISLRLWAATRPATVALPARPAPIPIEGVVISNASAEKVVLVTGAGGPAGVAVIRALRRAGHRVVACDADRHAVGFRLADEFARVPRADDPAFAESVTKAVTRSGAVALISTVAEELVPLHAAVASLAEAGAATWLPGPWSVEHCVDKWLFYQLMTEHGVPVPATAQWSERSVELAWASGHGVPGPWIVKPRFGRGSRDIYAAANAADLSYALSHAPEPLVQTKIIGREFTVDTLSGKDGLLHGAVPRWRLETKAGISTKGVTFRHHELVDLVAEVLGALRLEGPACVQGFRADDGQLVFTEVNPRFSGGLPLSLAAGADLVGECLSRILGGVVRPERLAFRSGVTMLRYFDEVFEE